MDFRSADTPEDIQRIFSEINLLRGLNHPNIVNLVDAFPLGQSMTFVMELCGGGELQHYLKEVGPLPEEEVYSIANQTCEGVRY